MKKIVQVVSDSENDEYNPSIKRKRPSKPQSSHGSNAEWSSKGTKRRKLTPNLTKLMCLSVDVFLEIATHLPPIDLLNLSITNKFIRGVVCSRSARFVWKESLANVPGLPECPEELTEPQYASLVFQKHCMWCDDGGLYQPKYLFKFRACRRHTNEQVTAARGLIRSLGMAKHQNKLLDLIPLGKVQRRTIVTVRAEAIVVIQRYSELVSAKNETDLENFIQEQAARMKARYDFLYNMKAYHELTRRASTMERDGKSDARYAGIKDRLLKLGWDAELFDMVSPRRDEWSRLTRAPTLLSEAIWKRIRPQLESILEARSEHRVRRELVSNRGSRFNEIMDLYIAWAEQVSSDTNAPFSSPNWLSTFPPPKIAVKLPSLRSLLLGTSRDYRQPITQDVWDSMRDSIFRDVEKYQRSYRGHLCALLSGASTTEGTKEEAAPRFERNIFALSDSDASNFDGLPKDLVSADDTDPTFPPLFDISDEQDGNNARRLNQPDALFQRSLWQMDLETYPSIAGPFESLPMGTSPGKFVVASHDAADMARSLIGNFTSASILSPDVSTSELTALGPIFVCDCCPNAIKVPFRWSDLVQHFLYEKAWFDATEIEHDRQDFQLPPPLETEHNVARNSICTNTHAEPCAHLLTSNAEGDAHFANLSAIDADNDDNGNQANIDPFSDFWALFGPGSRDWQCDICEFRGGAAEDMARWKSRKRALLHVQTKHGCSVADSISLITHRGSYGREYPRIWLS